MAEAMLQQEPIVVSPEEERFLRGFFRRQMLPWVVALVVISVTAIWWLADDDGSVREARIAAALAQVRTENQALRAEIAAVTEIFETGSSPDRGADELERQVEDAKRSVRMIESRITAALERRIDALEVQASAPSESRGEAPPADVAAWDVSAILDRLYALEMRDAGGVSEHRVSVLEERVAGLETSRGSLPAAPALD
ncbi:MAG: hypothetical protein GY772_04835 [bacterium]|nr:hypothetical protein [bacterium]